MAGSRTPILCRHLLDPAISVSNPPLSNKRKHDVSLSCRRPFRSPASAAATQSKSLRYPRPCEYDIRRDSQISTEQEYVDIPEEVVARPAAVETEAAGSFHDSNASVMYKREDDGCGSPSRIPALETSLHLRDAATRNVGPKSSSRKNQKALAATKEVPAYPRSLLSLPCPARANDFAFSRFSEERQAREEMDRSARRQQRLASPKQQQNMCQFQKPRETREQSLQKKRNGVGHSHVKCLEPCVYPVDCDSRTKENLGSVAMHLSEDGARASVPVAFAATGHADVETSPPAMVKGSTTTTKAARDESRASVREEGSTGEASRAAVKMSGRKNKFKPCTCARRDHSSNATCASDAAASTCLTAADNIQTSRARPQTRHTPPADMTSSRALSASGKGMNFFSPVVSSTPSTSFMSLSSCVPHSAGQVSCLRPLQPRPTVSSRALDGRSPLPRTAPSGNICGTSLSVNSAGGSCFFSSMILSGNPPVRGPNGPKIFSTRVHLQRPSVERLPLFRKLIEEAEHAHWERRQQKLQVVRQQQQQHAYIRQLLEQHAQQRSSASTTYNRYTGCGFAANCSQIEIDGPAPGRKRMPQRESRERRRWIVNIRGATTGAGRATDGCVAAASRPPTFSTLRHVIRAHAACRAARAEQQRQSPHGLGPTHRRYKNLRERCNDSSRGSANSRISSRIKPCLTDRRAVKQRFRAKEGEEHGDGGRTSAPSCSSSAEATTGCSSSCRRQGDFSRSISSTSSAASGGFQTFEGSESEEGSSGPTGHDIRLSQRESPGGDCRNTVENDTWFGLSSPSSTARGHTWFRISSSGQSSYLSKAYLRRELRVGLAAGVHTPRTCNASVSARAASIEGREGPRAASAAAADGRRKNSEPIFTVESSLAGHTDKVAEPSSLAEQASPVSGRPAEEEKVSVARVNLAAYVKHFSSSSGSSNASDRAWGQKKWPSHMKKQERKRKTKQELLSSSARCKGSVSPDASCNNCPRTHDHPCRQSKPSNDSLFRRMRRLQEQEELPLEQWQQQQQPQAEQKLPEKYYLTLPSGEERGLCLLSGERRNGEETKHGYAANHVCSTHSHSVLDSFEQPRESQQHTSAAAEGVTSVEAAGARDTGHFPAAERARNSTSSLETVHGRAGVATVSSFRSRPTAGGLVAGREATTPPAKLRKHIGRKMLSAFGQSQCLYSRACSLIRSELSLRAATAVALEQGKVDVSKEKQQPRQPPHENWLQSFREQLLERFPKHSLHNGDTEGVADQPWFRPDFSASDAKSSSMKEEQKKRNKRPSVEHLGKRENSHRNWMAASEDMPFLSAEDSAPQYDDLLFLRRLYSLRKAAAAAGTQSGSVVAAAAAAPRDFLLGSSAKGPIRKPSFVDKTAVSQSNAGAAQSAAAAAAAPNAGAGKNSGLSAVLAREEMRLHLMSGAVPMKSPTSLLHNPELLLFSPTISAAAAATRMTATVPSNIAPLLTHDPEMCACDDAFPSPGLLPGAAAVAAAAAASSADTSFLIGEAAAHAGLGVAPVLRAAERELHVLHRGKKNCEIRRNVSSSSSNAASTSSSGGARAAFFVHIVKAGETETKLQSVSPLYAPSSAPRAAKAIASVGENAHNARNGRQHSLSLPVKDRKGIISGKTDGHCSSSSRSNSRSRSNMNTWNIDNGRCSSSTRSMSEVGWGEQFKVGSSRDGSVKRRGTTTAATRGYMLLVSHEGSKSEGNSDLVERPGAALGICFSPVDADAFSEQIRKRKGSYFPAGVPAAAGVMADNRTISAREEAIVGHRLSSGGDPGYHSESSAEKEAAASEAICSRFFQGGGTAFIRKTSSSASQVKEELCPQVKRENCCSDGFRHIITKAREYRSGIGLLAKHHQAAALQMSCRGGIHSDHACRIGPAEDAASKPQKRHSTTQTTLSGEDLAAAVAVTTQARVWTAAGVDKAAAARVDVEAASPAPHTSPHSTTVFLEPAARTAAPGATAIFPPSAVAARADAVAADPQGVAVSPAAPSEVAAAAASAKAAPTWIGFSTSSAARAAPATRAGSPAVAAAPTCAAKPLAARVKSALQMADLRVAVGGEENIQVSVLAASGQQEGVCAAHSKSQLSSATRSCHSSEQERVSKNQLGKGKYEEEEEKQKSRISRENETGEFAIVVRKISDTCGDDSWQPAAVAGEIIVASGNSAATHSNASSGSNYHFCEGCSLAICSNGSAKRTIPDNIASIGPVTTAPAMPTSATSATGIAVAAEAFCCGHHVDVGCDFFESESTSSDTRPPACTPMGSSSSPHIQRDLHVESDVAVRKAFSGPAVAASAASLPHTRESVSTAVVGPCLAVASAALPVDAGNRESLPPSSVKVASYTYQHFQKHWQALQHQDLKQQPAAHQDLQRRLCIDKQSSRQKKQSPLVQQCSKQQPQCHQHQQQQTEQEQPNSARRLAQQQRQRGRQLQSLLRQPWCTHQPSKEQPVSLEQARPQRLQEVQQQPESQQRGADKVYCPFVLRAALSDSLTATQMSTSLSLCSNCSSRSDGSRDSVITTAAATPSTQSQIPSRPSTALHFGHKGRTGTAASGSPAMPAERGSRSVHGTLLAAACEPLANIVSVSGSAPVTAAAEKKELADCFLLDSSPTVRTARCHQQQATERATQKFTDETASPSAEGKHTAVLTTVPTAETATTPSAKATGAAGEVSQISSVPLAEEAATSMIHVQNEQEYPSLIVDGGVAKSHLAGNVRTNRLMISTSLTSLSSLGDSCTEGPRLTQLLRHLLLLLQQQRRRSMDRLSSPAAKEEEIQEQYPVGIGTTAAAGDATIGKKAAAVSSTAGASPFIGSSSCAQCETPGKHYCAEAAAAYTPLADGVHLPTSTGYSVGALRGSNNKGTSPVIIDGSNSGKPNSPLQSNNGNFLDTVSKTSNRGDCSPVVTGSNSGNGSSVALGGNSIGLAAVRMRPSLPPPRPGSAIVSAAANFATRASAATHRAAEAAATMFASPAEASDAAALPIVHTAAAATSKPTGKKPASTNGAADNATQTGAEGAASPTVLVGTPDVADMCTQRAVTDGSASASPTPLSKGGGQQIVELSSQNGSAAGASNTPQVQALDVESVCSSTYNIGSIMQTVAAQRPCPWMPASKRCPQSADAAEGTNALKPDLSRESNGIRVAEESAAAGQYAAAETLDGSIVAAIGELLRAANAAEAAGPVADQAANARKSKSNDISPPRSASGAEEARTGECDDVLIKSETLRPLLLASLLGMLSLNESVLLPLLPSTTKDGLINCTGVGGGTTYDKTNMVPRSQRDRSGSSNPGEINTAAPKGEMCSHRSTPCSLSLSAISDAVPIGGAGEWMKTLPPGLQHAAAHSTSLMPQWFTSTALSCSASPLGFLQLHAESGLQQPQGTEGLRCQQQRFPVQPRNQLLATEEYSQHRPCQPQQQHTSKQVERQRCNPDASIEDAQQPNTAGKIFDISRVLERQHKRTTYDVARLDNLPEAAVACSTLSSGAPAATLGPADAIGTPVYSAAADAWHYTLPGEGRSLSLSQLQQASFSGSLSLQGLEEQRLQPQRQQQGEEQKPLQLQQQTQVKKPQLRPSQAPQVLPQMEQSISKDRFSSHCAAEQNYSSPPAANSGTQQLSEEQRRSLAPACLQQPQEPEQQQRRQLDQQWQRQVALLQQGDQRCMLQGLRSDEGKKQLQHDDGAFQLEPRQCLQQHLQQNCGQQQDRKTQRCFQLHDESPQQVLQHYTPLESLQRLRAPEAAERQNISEQWTYGIACGTDGVLKARKKKGAGTAEKRKGSRTESSRDSSSMRISSNRRHSSKGREDMSRRQHFNTRRSRRGGGSQRRTSCNRSLSRSTRRRSSGTVVHRKSDSSSFTSRQRVAHWETDAALMEKRKSRTDRCVSESATKRQRRGLSESECSTDNLVSMSTTNTAAKLSLPVRVAHAPDGCSTAVTAVADTYECSSSCFGAHKTCVQLKNSVSVKKNKKKEEKKLKIRSRKHYTSVEFDEVNCLNVCGVRQAAAAVEKGFSTSITGTEAASTVAQHRLPRVSCIPSPQDGQHLQRRLQRHLDPPSAGRQPQPKRCEKPACIKKQRNLSSCQRDDEHQGKRKLENIISTDARTHSDCSERWDTRRGSNSTPAAEHNTATHLLRKQSRTENRDDSTRINNSTRRKPSSDRQKDSTSYRGRSRTQIQRSVSRNRDHPDCSERSSSCMEESNAHDDGSSSLHQVTSTYRGPSQRDGSRRRSFRARPTPKASLFATSASERSGHADEQVLPMLRKHLQQQRELQEELEQVEQQLAGLHFLNSLTAFSGSISGTAAAVAPAETEAHLDNVVVSRSTHNEKRYTDPRETEDRNNTFNNGSSSNDLGNSRTDDRKNKSWSNTSGSTAFWTPVSTSMIATSLGERGQVAVSNRVRQSRSLDDNHLVTIEEDAADSCAFLAHVVPTTEMCHAKVCGVSKSSSRSAGSDTSDSCERIMGEELLQLSGGKVGGLVAVKQQLREACLYPHGDMCNEEDTEDKQELREETECCWRNGAGFGVATSPWKILRLHRPLSARRASGVNRFLSNSVKEAVEGSIQPRVFCAQAAVPVAEKQRRLTSRKLRGTVKQSHHFKHDDTSRRRSSDSPVILYENGRSSLFYSSKEICADEITHQRSYVAYQARASRISCQHTGNEKASMLKDNVRRAFSFKDNVRRARGATTISPEALNQQHAKRRSRQQLPQHSRLPERNLQTSMLFDSETDDAREEREQTPSDCEL